MSRSTASVPAVALALWGLVFGTALVTIAAAVWAPLKTFFGRRTSRRRSAGDHPRTTEVIEHCHNDGQPDGRRDGEPDLSHWGHYDALIEQPRPHTGAVQTATTERPGADPPEPG